MENEYICNVCGLAFVGTEPVEETECPECYAMDCQIVIKGETDE